MKITTPPPSNFHVEYLDVAQHWHGPSELYAGGDALLTRLYEGWQLGNTVWREEHWFAGMRSVTVYHFDLNKGEEQTTIPVINNPFVHRLVQRLPQEQIIPITEREEHHEERKLSD